jgi:hypothetical protein
MKVYILIGGIEYEGERIYGVFATKELAEAYQQIIEKDKSNIEDYFEIQEEDVIENEGQLNKTKYAKYKS